MGEPAAKSVLARSEIKKRLDKGQIFVEGSWDEDCLRGASYDLRAAPDYLIAPDGQRYWPGSATGFTERRAPIVLEPGDVAFVSSVERVCMPFQLAGNVAIKFRLGRRGLFVMGGLLVDPGYGLEFDGKNWVPRNECGERLHFQLANIGKKEIEIVPGETSFAAIQLMHIDGESRLHLDEPHREKVPDSGAMLDSMFSHGLDEPLEPLAFFSGVRDLREEVAKLRQASRTHEEKLALTNRSTDQLVVFGVVLIAITLFTVAVAAMLSALGDGVGGSDGVDFTLVGLGVAVGVVVLVGFVAWKIMQPAVAVVDSLRRRDRDSAG